ncbi:helix-turn-helix domain-containing protein [Alphaproteobacteria bacterium]|nr:helix-turn-helix domain-containing protein [Alphaproteobacteria bacterium]
MFKLLTKAVAAVGLKSSEKLVLIQIANLINESEGQIAWPSENTLAEQAGMSRKSVGRAKQKLLKLGLLTWYSPRQSEVKNSSCVYRIDENKLDEFQPVRKKMIKRLGQIDPPAVTVMVNETNGVRQNDSIVEPICLDSWVIKSIYTPTTPIKILLSDTNRVREIKESMGVITLDNWLVKAQECQTYKDPRPTQIFQHRWTNYQILHSFFNQELFRLSGISQAQWSLAVDKYCEQYRILPMGRDLETPNLKAFFPLVQYIAQSDRSEAAWRAVGGIGVDFPKLAEKPVCGPVEADRSEPHQYLGGSV